MRAVIDDVVCRLPCSFLALALLGSYAVQSDIGDHEPRQHGDGCGYISDFKFAARQGDELLEKIAELHKTHRCDVTWCDRVVRVAIVLNSDVTSSSCCVFN